MILLAASIFFATPSPLEMPKAQAYLVKEKGVSRLEDRFDRLDLWISRAVDGMWHDDDGREFMLATLGIIAIGLPAFMVPIVGIGKRIRHWSRRTLEKTSVVGSNIHEVLTCVRVTKAYGTEDYENRRYEETNRSLLGTTMRAVRCGLIVGPTIETIGILLICGLRRWHRCKYLSWSS